MINTGASTIYFMVKLAMIIALDGFSDAEYFEPKKVFQDSGFEVVTAALSARACKGSHGAKVVPDVIVGDLDEEELDAVVIVGGPGSTSLSESQSVLHLLSDTSDKGKVTAAICYGGLSLACSGIVKGKAISTFKDDYSEHVFKHNNVSFAPEGVTVLKDLMVVSASGPAYAKKFGEAIRDLLKE